MRNLSTEFKEQQNSGNRNYLKYADFTFTDGSTLSITDKDLWSNGFKFEDAVSQSGSFDIGAAIVNKLTLQINNFSGKYTDYIWDGARVVCHIGLELSTGIEKIRICTMTVTDAPYQNIAIISLTCEDSMRLFDRDYSDSKLAYPATRLQIIQDACEVCGVTLQSTRFDNDDFLIQNRPNDNSITFRQVIAWVAQMGCQWAKSDEYGRLCLGWYEREVPDKFYNLVETPWKDTEGNDILDTTGAQIITIMQKGITSTDTNGFTPWLYDLEITGVKVTEYVENSSQNEAKTYQSGKPGYVIEISDNKLIQEGTGGIVCQIIANRCVGLKFRPFTTGALTNIAWEAGDAIAISDRNGKEYKSYLTSVTLNPGNFEQLECSAKSVSRSNQKQYTLNQQIQAENKKNLKDERTAREKALEELSQRLAESSGTYTTVETQPDGSNIYYLHNKPQLSDSDIVWKMTAEAWAVSTDGGQHWNGGMTVDGDVIARILTATGVNADWINTGTIKAIDKDGNVTFMVDITTGRVVINADSVQIKGKDIDTIAKEKAESEVNDFISNTYTTDIKNLQSQIDGQIETFFYDYEPTLQNIPASEWTTNDERKKHEGDLFYWKSKGYAYRFMQDGATWKWQLVQDTDITLALAAAEKAQDTANGKRRVFVVQPEPPYDIGDLWAQGSTGDLMRCKVARASGAYSAEDWEKASKYTDDSSLTTFLNGAYKDTLSEIQSQLDGKSEVWYQATDPSLNWTTRQNVAWLDTNGEKILDTDGNEIILIWESEKAIHNGDLWYNTSNNTQWIYQNGNWEPTTIPDSLLDKIDGKSQVFVKEPVPPYEVNDLYFTGTEILVCVSSRETGDYNASDWTKKDNYTDDTALTEFIQNVYTDDIAKIQESLDGQIMTYFYDYTPTLDNLPASDWKTEEDRANHEGDLFYNKSDKRSYRFFKKDNVWTWDLVLDPEVNQALEQAQAAQDTADGKRRVFVTTPSAPYDVGDLWVQGESGDIMRCRTAKTDKQSYDSADWIKASKYTDDTKAKEVEKQLGTVKKDLQIQIDGKIESFNQESDPSTSWTTETLKAQHKGDLWYNPIDKVTKRWSGTEWTTLDDATALAAQELAKNKRRVFSSQPIPPYDIGDLWCQGGTGDIMQCKTAKPVGGAFDNSDWQRASKYTDDSAFNDFLDGVFKDTISSLKTQIDGKIETWYQPTDPSIKWKKTEEQSWLDTDGNKILDTDGNEIVLIWESEKVEHEGDLWHNTTDNTQWIYKSGVWMPQSIPDELLDKIDGKSSVYMVQPTPPYYEGDLWVTTDGEGKAALKTSTVNRASGEFDASDWIDFKYADKKDIQDAIENYDTSLGQDEVFNKLTKGGTEQGIYIEDGKVYINAKYILAGLLAGERINGRGLKVIDDDKNVTLEIDSKGNVILAPKTFSLQGKTVKEIADSSASTAVSGQTQADIFSKLTNGGKAQGIYLDENGNVYVNGEYVQAKGIRVVDSNGKTTFSIDKETGAVTILASSFLLGDKSIADIAQEKVNGQTQNDIFNKLTSNGAIKGLYMKDGQIYFSFSYAQGGILKLGGENNGFGSLEILDVKGKSVAKIDNTSITIYTSYTDNENWNAFCIDLGTENTQFRRKVNGSLYVDTIPFETVFANNKLYLNLLIYNLVVNGVINVTKSDLSEAQVNVSNSSISGRLVSSANKNFGLYHITFSKWLIRMGEDGNAYLPDTIFKGTATFNESTKFDGTATFDKGTIFNGTASFSKTTTFDETASFQKAPKLYNLTHVTSGGHLVMGTDGATVSYLGASSLRYKTIGKTVKEEDLEEAYKIKVIWARYKNEYLDASDERYGKEMPMFLAEDIDQHFPLAVDHDEKGRAENWNYRIMIPCMFAMLKNEHEKVIEVKKENENLKSEIQSIKNELQELKQLLMSNIN